MKKQLLTTTICIVTFFTQQLFGQANEQLSNLISPTQVNQHLLPGTDNSKNLGSSSKSWKNLYLDGDMYIDGNRFTYLPTSTSTFVGNTANTTSTGVGNSALGYRVLMANTSGIQNSGLGAYPLEFNTTGRDNTALGYAALNHNTTGSYNCAIGSFALFNNTSSNNNSAFGYNSLRNNNTGDYNSAFGAGALYSNTTGYYNSAHGYEALEENTTGHNNTANGFWSLHSNTLGNYNTASGSYALYANTTGASNTATGYFALDGNITGGNNTANGYYALSSNTIGSSNTATGYSAGSFSNNFSHCTLIGYDADQSGFPDLDNSTALGNNSRITSSNQVRIGNSSVSSIGGYASWTNISDGRYKKEIRENVPGLEFINKLTPVTYHLDVTGIKTFLGEDITGEETREGFKEKSAEEKALGENGVKEKEQIVYTGFIAQDVETAAKEIGYDFSGVDKPQNESSLYGLRYSEFVVPIVKAVQELSSENDELKSRIEKLELLMGLNDKSKVPNAEQQTIELKGMDVPSLGQNVPNPFNNITVISYYVPQQDAKAQMQFVSVTGEVLQTTTLSAGKGNVTVKASEIPSGTYQYSLLVNGKVIATKNMNLIK
ncbi:MAG: tail fiber domain-containing protein [Chitinophagales bacterium]